MYQKGDIIKGVVSGIEPYGIFVKIDDDYSGLIHISEISSKFVRNVGDYVKQGEVIKIKILDIVNYYVYNVCVHEECYAEVGSQAISYTTGVPAMIGAMMVMTGKWQKPGV